MPWELTGNEIDATNFLGTTNDQSLVIKTNNTEAMRIATDGNVGIGTSSPQAVLDVEAKTQSDFGTAEFRPVEGPASHIHYGQTGDWYIRSAKDDGKVIIQDSGGNVGIGTNEPVSKLDVHGEVHAFGRISTGLDFQSPGVITFFPLGGTAWFHIDNTDDGGPVENRIGRLRISIGDKPGDSEVVNLWANGNVGIGVEREPDFKLDVAGQVHGSDFLITSDARLKTDITQLTGVLDKLTSIRGVSFKWNKPSEPLDRSSERRQIGILGQELEAVYPELVTRAGEQDYLAIDYCKLTAVLLEAIKELRTETDTKIRRLESELVTQREEINLLRQQIVGQQSCATA